MTAARGQMQGRTTRFIRNRQATIPISSPREETVPVVPLTANVAQVRGLRDQLNRILATMDQISSPRDEHAVLLNDEPHTQVNHPQNNTRNLSYLDYRREFHISNPPIFDGSTNPTKADTWLYTIEEEFDNLDVPNGYRVKLAVGLLIDRACRWR